MPLPLKCINKFDFTLLLLELGFWTEGQTCSNLAMAFNGNLGFTKQEAKSACADACNKEDDCMFADLYYSSSRQICRISSTCGDWIKGKNSAYSLYQKQGYYIFLSFDLKQTRYTHLKIYQKISAALAKTLGRVQNRL